MKRCHLLAALALAIGLLPGCGGDGGEGGEGAGGEVAVRPIEHMQPGEKFAMETPLWGGGSQVSHYVVYGVTPGGALVDRAEAGLMDGVRVSILESVERGGRRSDQLPVVATAQSPYARFVDPQALRQKQVAFYQALWNAVAEHEDTRDPQAILAEIDDLDGRIVDLMDDVAAAGWSLKDYLAVYDRLDALPAFASKQLPELNLREALADAGGQASVFDDDPPGCSTRGRATLPSGLFTDCRAGAERAAALFPPKADRLSDLPALPRSGADAPLDAAVATQDLDAWILTLQMARLTQLDTLIHQAMDDARARSRRITELSAVLARNGEDDERWRAYCAQRPVMPCPAGAPNASGAWMRGVHEAMIEDEQSQQQIAQLHVQSLIARRNASIEMLDALRKKAPDLKAAVLANMR